MSLNQNSTLENAGQSIGCDPKSSKRNSGLFAFFKWFKPSSSRESISDADLQISRSSSCDSLNSTYSVGTVASFSYVPPSAYKKCISEKCIVLGPETDTYKARLKQRDKRRENDKNVTLRKKYNLFFNRDTLKTDPLDVDEENTKSLPLMTRPTMQTEEDIKIHRRTNSESSKLKRAGAYLHVKGKRRAPPPPGSKSGQDATSTASLRRKKRLAPSPPIVSTERVIKSFGEAHKSEDADIICNDTLKLDHGILKSAKETGTKPSSTTENSLAVVNSPTSARSSYVEAPVSPRPWYKRNVSKDSPINKKEKHDHKYEPIEVPEVPYKRNSTLDLTLEEVKVDKKKDENRKSGMSFLTNISELDREASAIIKNKDYEKNGFGDIPEMPQFMRPKETKINLDSWVSPKRRSAKDLIAKFNAITNVTKVTVFGASPKDAKLFGKQTSLDETKRRQESLLESHKKKIDEIDKKNCPLMKSESASAIKTKPETPRLERKSWKCPKCNLENEYWRIICHVCSAIKPYFDDFSSTKTDVKQESKTSSPLVTKKGHSPPKKIELGLERSRTQIGFSTLTSCNAVSKNKSLEKNASIDENSRKEVDTKKEEKEKLKKMLIEMKNSLPKRKSNILLKQNSRASVIVENPETVEEAKNNKELSANKVEVALDSEVKTEKEIAKKPEKTQEQKVAEILIGTTQTIYENIKIKKVDNPKPTKVSSSVQTKGVMKQIAPVAYLTKDEQKPDNTYEQYELMRPKDFEDIYADANSKSAARIYANLARNDELSLFFNMPKNLDIKNNVSNKGVNHADTIEINRLLKRLETAIAKGDLTEAAIFAKELAQLKVNCSVVRQKPSPPRSMGIKRKGIEIEMYVEDKISHRGPFPIQVIPEQTVAELKLQVEKEFEIPAEYQRWILGKELVVDEYTTLKDHNITTEGCPVFLYLVAPDTKCASKKLQTPNLDTPSTSKIFTPTDDWKVKEEKHEIISTPENEFDKVRANVQNLQNYLKETSRENKEIKMVETVQPTKLSPDHTPKIVDVIPKTVEPKSKPEVRIIPIQTERASVKQKTAETKMAVKEMIKVDEKPEHGTNTSKPIVVSRVQIEHKPIHLLTSQEVKPKIQYVFPTILNSTQNDLAKGKSESSFNTVQPPELNTPVTTGKNADKLGLVKGETAGFDSKMPGPSQSNELVRTQEDDEEEFDTKTLKPSKEWECHLCTLLNPITSNVCAVCATVRLNREKLPMRKHVKKKAPQPSRNTASKSDQTYLQLMDLDNTDLVETIEHFECLVCFLEIPPKEGVTLRECLHQFCKACLAYTVEFNEEAEVKCPYRDDEYSCNIALQDREIKALVTPSVYEQHLAKSVAQAENKIDKSFHCKTPDCKGWCIFEDNVNEFRCPVCRRVNCLTCQAIHSGMNCKQYQEKMNDDSGIDDDARRTRDMLEEMVKNGEAIECPTCKVILMKKWGCDWLRCSMCKTEICWVTRGPRWGPSGKGDISGGCQCGVNGAKCHPKCNYCH